jgi:hypothetical protein
MVKELMETSSSASDQLAVGSTSRASYRFTWNTVEQMILECIAVSYGTDPIPPSWQGGTVNAIKVESRSRRRETWIQDRGQFRGFRPATDFTFVGHLDFAALSGMFGMFQIQRGTYCIFQGRCYFLRRLHYQGLDRV